MRLIKTVYQELSQIIIKLNGCVYLTVLCFNIKSWNYKYLEGSICILKVIETKKDIFPRIKETCLCKH